MALEVEDGIIRKARIGLGGVATKPWRSDSAEDELVGAPLGESAFNAAAAATVREAVPRQYNSFKVELIQRMLVHALKNVGGMV